MFIPITIDNKSKQTVYIKSEDIEKIAKSKRKSGALLITMKKDKEEYCCRTYYVMDSIDYFNDIFYPESKLAPVG
jgi:Holliday junction resolvase